MDANHHTEPLPTQTRNPTSIQTRFETAETINHEEDWIWNPSTGQTRPWSRRYRPATSAVEPRARAFPILSVLYLRKQDHRRETEEGATDRDLRPGWTLTVLREVAQIRHDVRCQAVDPRERKTRLLLSPGAAATLMPEDRVPPPPGSSSAGKEDLLPLTSVGIEAGRHCEEGGDKP